MSDVTTTQFDASPVPSPMPATPPSNNVLAIVSLVTAFIAPLAAIVTGHLALRQLRSSGEHGLGLAKAGLILGYVFTSVQVLFLIGWTVAFFLVATRTG